jgi:hypothetical protein
MAMIRSSVRLLTAAELESLDNGAPFRTKPCGRAEERASQLRSLAEAHSVEADGENLTRRRENAAVGFLCGSRRCGRRSA